MVYSKICFKSCLVLFCSCLFSVILALRLPRLGKGELILVLFVRLFDLRLFRFVCLLFLLVSEKGCGLRLWHSLDFSLTFFHLLMNPKSDWDMEIQNILNRSVPISKIAATVLILKFFK